MQRLNSHSRRRAEKGFTLIEVIVSLLLAAILMGMAGLGVVQVARGFIQTREAGELAQKSDFVLTRIRKSVRNLMGVNTANATTLSLSRLDANQTSVTDIFSYSGTTLSLGDGTNNAPLMEGVSAFQFQYFDEDNNPWVPATDPIGELALVDVSLTMTGNEGVSVNFSERILPRNTYTPSRAYTPAGAGTPSAQGLCLVETLYPNNPALLSLFRSFRDNGLAAIPLVGKKMTAAYYLTGSAVTPWIAAHPDAAPFLKWLAAPVVALLFFWAYFPAGLLALGAAAWILGRLFAAVLLPETTTLAPISRRFREAGSILLSLVITITMVALLGAGAVSMLATSEYSNVHSAFGEKAYYLAESGLRYAVSRFMANRDDSAAFISDLSSSEADGAFSVSTTGEAFDLGARCYFFDPDDSSPGTTLQAFGDGFPGKIGQIAVPGGGLPGHLEVYDTGLSDRVVVNATVSSINTSAGTIAYTITGGLSGAVAADEYVLPVAQVSTTVSNVRASNLGEAPTASQISLDGFAAFFPAVRGVVSLMADADNDGSYDDRIDMVYDRLNGTTLVGLRNLPGKAPLPSGGVDIAANTPVVLGRYASITSRGIVAKGTSQEAAVRLTLNQPLDTVDIMRMVTNTTPGEQSAESRLGAHEIQNDNSLKVTETESTYSFIETNNPTLQQESVAAQDWALSDMTGGSNFLKELWLRSDKRLSYETQVKVKFTETEDDRTSDPVNHPGCYMPGIAFRLRQVGPHPGQATYYGMSFMRGITGRTQNSTGGGCGSTATTWKSEDDDISDNLFADHGSNSAFTYASTCPNSKFTPTTWNDDRPLDGIPYLVFWQKDQSTNADGTPLSTGCGGSVSSGYSPFEWLSYMPLVTTEKRTIYQYDDTPNAYVYSSLFYSGNEAGFPVGEYTLADIQARGMSNDDIASVRVTSGYTLTLYEHDNFGGRSLTRTSDDPSLLDNTFWEGIWLRNWANRTSSLKVSYNGSTSRPSSGRYDGAITGPPPSATYTAWKLTDPYGLFKTYTIDGVEVLGLPGAWTIMDPTTAFDAGGPTPVANTAYIVFPGPSESNSANKRDLNYRLYLKEWTTVGLQIFEIEGDLDCNAATGTNGVERVNAVSAFFGSNAAAGNTAQAENSLKDGNRKAYPVSTADTYLSYPVKWLNDAGYFTEAVWDGLGIQNTDAPRFPTDGGYTSKLVPNPYGSGCGGNTDIKLVEKGKDLEGDNTYVYSATFLTKDTSTGDEYDFDTEYIPEIGLDTLGISAEPGAAAAHTETAYFKDWYWRFFEGGQTGMVPGIISE